MAVLRFLALIMLALWIGGLAVLAGSVAPSVFQILQVHDPIAGRELAGEVFGAVFRRFQPLAWICGGVLVLLLALRTALGPRPRRLTLRIWTLLAMLAVSVGTATVIVPRIDRLRETTSGPIAGLAADDARRVAFNRLHGLSNVLMLLTIGAGCVLLWCEATDAG